jgi:2-iminobutanoate/2-iminopropanoate deaminase
MKTINAAPPVGHYSQAVEANGLLFISGLLPITATGIRLGDKEFAAQARQVFINMDEVLAASGTNRTQLAQVRVYLSDIANWPEFNTLYAAWLGDHRPARCVVPVPELHYGLALEVEAVAVL